MIRKVFFLIIIVSLFLSGCSAPTVKGSGNAIEESRDINYVSKVEINGNFKVDIVCGETNSLKIEAEDNILPFIETKVEDEKITIKTKEKITNLREIRITLTIHTLEELESEGKSTISVKSINSDELDIEMDGEGEIVLEGKADDLDISIDGDGKLFAKDLQSKNAYVTLYGEGKAEVYARKALKAKVKGEGVIDYWGDPEDISIDTAKGGAVNKQ